MKELRSEDTTEEFFKVTERAASIGDEYKGLLSQINKYMTDNDIDWFDPGMVPFRISVMTISRSTSTAVENMNIDG